MIRDVLIRGAVYIQIYQVKSNNLRVHENTVPLIGVVGLP